MPEPYNPLAAGQAETCSYPCGNPEHDHSTDVAERLEYLRGEIRAERISWGEIAELQGLAPHIDRSDVELLEWVGMPEYDEDDDTASGSDH